MYINRGDSGETKTREGVALGAESIRNVLWASELWLQGGDLPTSLPQTELGMQLSEMLAQLLIPQAWQGSLQPKSDYRQPDAVYWRSQ